MASLQSLAAIQINLVHMNNFQRLLKCRSMNFALTFILFSFKLWAGLADGIIGFLVMLVLQ